MLLSAVSVLVVAQRSSEVPEGLMNNPVYWNILTMHVPINVKTPNNTSKWQMGFNSAFKGLIQYYARERKHVSIVSEPSTLDQVSA
jgi:hypothetical protein